MNDESSLRAADAEEKELLGRRLFLRSLGKWSGAAIAAAVVGRAWVASPPEAKAGGWINRRGGYGGGWVNRWAYGGSGAWVNRW